MHQNSPTAIYILKNFSAGETPRPPFFRRGEGGGRRKGREGEGVERVGRGRVRKGKEGRRKRTPGATHPLKTLATPLQTMQLLKRAAMMIRAHRRHVGFVLTYGSS